MNKEGNFIKIPTDIFNRFINDINQYNSQNNIQHTNILQSNKPIKNPNIQIALRNLNDGLSLLETMEKSLEEISLKLSSIYELLILIEKNCFSDDVIIQYEKAILKIVDEINAISKQTSFNGIYLLDSEKEIKINTGHSNDDFLSLNTISTVLEETEDTIKIKQDLKNRINTALDNLSEHRATVGANKNRIDFIMGNLIANR